MVQHLQLSFTETIVAKSKKNSADSKTAKPIQNLPPKDPKSDDRIKGGATTEGVKKTMQTQV